MIASQQVMLERRSNNCIWCRRMFLFKGKNLDESVNFGPVQRSNEHIIPANIGGVVVTPDLCKNCNDQFGRCMDFHLLRDERVVSAGVKAGLDYKDLVKSFRGTRHTRDGREFEGSFQNGTFWVIPHLTDFQGLSVGSEDGKIRESDLRNLENRLTEKIKAKFNLNALTPELGFRIKRLIDSVATCAEQIHYDPVLREGFKPTKLSSSVKVQVKSDPWITDWCIAKMLFEATEAIMPASFLSYLKPVQAFLKNFVIEGMARHYDGAVTSCFTSSDEGAAGLWHSISCHLGQAS